MICLSLWLPATLSAASAGSSQGSSWPIPFHACVLPSCHPAHERLDQSQRHLPVSWADHWAQSDLAWALPNKAASWVMAGEWVNQTLPLRFGIWDTQRAGERFWKGLCYVTVSHRGSHHLPQINSGVLNSEPVLLLCIGSEDFSAFLYFFVWPYNKISMSSQKIRAWSTVCSLLLSVFYLYLQVVF